MKTRSTIFFFFLAVLCAAQTNQTHFKSEIDFGNGTVFSTFLDISVKKNQFTITSPRNADVRIMGAKARLGRLFGKSPKKGIIIRITGDQKKDSLFGTTKIPMFGALKFKGAIKNATLTGDFFSNDTTSIGLVSGVKSAEKTINYSYLYPLVLNKITENIYSKNVLKTAEWKNFQKKIEKLFHGAHDDIELFLGFNIYTQQLPFTHLSFLITQDDADNSENSTSQKTVFFEELNSNTAYVRIKNFGTSKEELASTMPMIAKNKNFKNLIVDLRDNPGGGIDAAFEFAKYITDSDTQVGYFVTNKLKYSGYEPELFKSLPELQPKSTKAFTDDLKTLPGVKLIFKKPNNPIFSGKLFILTNSGTGSTCEPIVYVLKNNNKATIIGQKTAGAMLAANPFEVSGKYTIMVPIADFYTYDGVRLDKVGVSPNVEVKSEEALAKALELINTKAN